MQSAGEPGVNSTSAETPACASAESGRNRRNEFVLIILATACSNCLLHNGVLHNGVFHRPDFDSTFKSELWKSSHRVWSLSFVIVSAGTCPDLNIAS
jgi:hypothetical protein